jgi:hypothetical protein
MYPRLAAGQLLLVYARCSVTLSLSAKINRSRAAAASTGIEKDARNALSRRIAESESRASDNEYYDAQSLSPGGSTPADGDHM